MSTSIFNLLRRVNPALLPLLNDMSNLRLQQQQKHKSRHKNLISLITAIMFHQPETPPGPSSLQRSCPPAESRTASRTHPSGRSWRVTAAKEKMEIISNYLEISINNLPAYLSDNCINSVEACMLQEPKSTLK
jgi:hypothetical protein